MTRDVRHRLAALIVATAARIMPPATRHWGVAMRHEVDTIDCGHAAMIFALGGCDALSVKVAVPFFRELYA